MSDQGSRVAAVIVCYTIPIPLEILATSLRLFAKLRQHGRDSLALDDFFIVFATVCLPIQTDNAPAQFDIL